MLNYEMEEMRGYMNALLAELPAEFSYEPGTGNRSEFRVIKERNVRAVHEALWEMQRLLGMNSVRTIRFDPPLEIEVDE